MLIWWKQILGVFQLGLTLIEARLLLDATKASIAPSSKTKLEEGPTMKKKFYYFAHIQGWLGFRSFSFDRIECGGSIIAENWVLTAATCFSEKQYNYAIQVDSMTPYQGRDIKIETVITYSRNTIALVKTELIKFSNDVDLIFLPTKKNGWIDLNGQMVFSTGMRIEQNIFFNSKGLKETDMIIKTDAKSCPASLSPFYICAIPKKKYKNYGKAGSPIILRTHKGLVLVGIILRNDYYHKSVIVININHFINWIEDETLTIFG